MRRIGLYILIAISVLLVASCEPPKDSEVLIANEWKLKTMSAVKSVIMPEHDSYTLSFDTVDNRLFGRGNCNLYFADYTLGEGNVIVVNQPGATMMMCHDDNAEREYLDMLEAASFYRISDDNLELLSVDSTLISVFTPYIQPLVQDEE